MIKKETFGQRLRKIREAKGLSQAELAQKMDTYQSRYQNWEIDRHEPDYEILKKLATVLEVSVEWLLEGEDIYKVKEATAAYMPSRSVPLISWVRAGAMHYPIDNLQPGESEGPPVSTSCKDPNAFALRVKGDSMMPEFQEGELIIVSPNTEWHSNDYVIAKLDGEVTFKRIKVYPDAIILRPLNEKYEEIVIKGKAKKDLKIIGKIIEKVKKY